MGVIPDGLSVYLASSWWRWSVEVVAKRADWGRTYSAGGGLLLGALSIDLEGNTVGGGALDLKGGG